MLRTIARDFAGIGRVCGWGTALRWLMMIALNFPACWRKRSLNAADRAMGDGPFRTQFRGRSRATISGAVPFGGIRELWVRDVYLRNDYLTVRDGDFVVDLGAHQGVFTALLLGHGPNVRAVAIEALPANAENLRRQLAANGWENRCQVCNAFIGGETTSQADMKSRGNAAAVETISETEFIRRHNIKRIDLLKVDIEGSEYGLLMPESKLLAMTRQLTLEAHDFAGEPKRLAEMLAKMGFEMSEPIVHSGCWLMQARRG